MRRRTGPPKKRPGARLEAPDDRARPRAFLRRADFARGSLSGSDEIGVRNLIDFHNDVARLGETMERVLEGQTGEGADQLRALLPKYAELQRLVSETIEEITSHEAD